MQQIDFLSSTEAAWYLKYSENTLRASRTNGILGGKTTPQYRKLGGKILYTRTDLDDWINSIPVQTNTSENMEQYK